MEIIDGEFILKLNIRKKPELKREFMEFVRTKTTDGAIINDIDAINFEQIQKITEKITVNLPNVTIDLNFKESRVTMLFHSTMTTTELNEYTQKWFT